MVLFEYGILASSLTVEREITPSAFNSWLVTAYRRGDLTQLQDYLQDQRATPTGKYPALAYAYNCGTPGLWLNIQKLTN